MALVALIVLAPVIILVSLVVALSIGRPVIFRQRRRGKGGSEFTLLKFRTMDPDRRGPAPEFGYRGPERRRTHKSTIDPRHTRVGRTLRALSLDELPQLWNVLRGEMSIVGPRPELPEVIRAAGIDGHVRETVLPGLTGLWQVSADRNNGIASSLHYDERYVERVRALTDVAVILRTPIALLKNRGT